MWPAGPGGPDLWGAGAHGLHWGLGARRDGGWGNRSVYHIPSQARIHVPRLTVPCGQRGHIHSSKTLALCRLSILARTNYFLSHILRTYDPAFVTSFHRYFL